MNCVYTKNKFNFPYTYRNENKILDLFNICGSVHHALYWWNKSNKMQQLRFLFAMAYSTVE